MIISNSNKYIFIHIMKAAGTSVTRALDSQAKWNDLVIGGTPLGEAIQPHFRERYQLHKHSTAREIRDIVGAEVWKSYFKFAFVRHPYSRTVSLFTFAETLIKRQGVRRYLRHLPFLEESRAPIWTSWKITKARLASRSFSEFIRDPNFQQVIPQTDYVTDENGNVIIDHIAKVETIEQDFAHIAQKLGIELSTIQRANRSSPKDWNSTLTRQEDFEIIQELFKRDFAVFHYDSHFQL